MFMIFAAECGLSSDRVICGGDHLGPLTKRKLDEAEAMNYADELVREYALAGFTKIHLDTSMRLGSDPEDRPLPDEVVAERGARLCRIAEDAFSERLKKDPGGQLPLYIIGSEVPVPGGTESDEDEVPVTTPEQCRQTYETYRAVFRRHGLSEAFERVVGLVVQTGAEFSDNAVHLYSSEPAAALSEYGKKNLPVVFEGHSTDYQTEESLRAMVTDGVAIIKVGPALTFALREALAALEHIEKELYCGKTWTASSFSKVLES